MHGFHLTRLEIISKLHLTVQKTQVVTDPILNFKPFQPRLGTPINLLQGERARPSQAPPKG
jgi:hypothetical protein